MVLRSQLVALRHDFFELGHAISPTPSYHITIQNEQEDNSRAHMPVILAKPSGNGDIKFTWCVCHIAISVFDILRGG